MGIVKTKTRLQKDTKGLLTKLVLDIGNVTKVYIPDDKVNHTLLDINIIALSVGDSIVSLWVMPKDNASPEMVDLLEHNLIFAQNSVYVRTNIELGEGECLVAVSDSANLVMRITGHEDRTP